MKRVYTGPFSAVYRQVWVERARQMRTDEWLWLMPTRHLLRHVREQLSIGRRGTVNLPLLTFDEVAAHLVMQSGQPVHALQPHTREKLIGKLLERFADDKHLAVFRSIIDTPGLSRSVAHAIGDMKRAGLTENDVDRYLHQAPIDDHAVGHTREQRQRALGFLFLRYQEVLQADDAVRKVDPEETLRMACEALEQENVWRDGVPNRGQALWIDHFTDFSPLQLRLLRAMVAQAADVGIYIPFPQEAAPQLPQLRKQLEKTIAQLEKSGVEWVELSRLSQRETLVRLEADWGRMSNDVPHSAEPLLPAIPNATATRRLAPDGLECLPACSSKREVDMVAKEVKRLVRLEGVPLHDIAVVVNDTRTYEPLLHDVMQRDGIPLDRDAYTTLHGTAMARQVMSLLSLVAKDWQRHDVLSLAQGGYFRWQQPPPSGIETWARQIGIEQGMHDWLNAVEREITRLTQAEKQENFASVTDDEKARHRAQLQRKRAKMQQTQAWLHEVAQLADRLQSAQSWEARIRQTEKVLTELDTERCIRRLWRDDLKRGEATGYRRDLAAYRQLWQTLQDMQHMQTFVANRSKRSWAGFMMEMRELLARRQVIVTPKVRGGLRVFDPSGIRGLSFHTVFVLGLNEGQFPAFHNEDWLIRDAERVAFYQGQARLPASYAHDEMERLFFAMALSAATERLILAYVSPNADERVLRSQFLERVEQAFACGMWQHPDRFREAMTSRLFAENPQNISSPEEYQHYHMWHWSRSDDVYRPANDEMLKPLMPHAAIERERREGMYGRWDGFLSDPRILARLRETFSTDRTYSVSWFNDYAACPLHFFFARVLGVRELDEAESTLAPIDAGNVCHEVLRRLFARHKDKPMHDQAWEDWKKELADVFHIVSAEWETERPYVLSRLWPLEKSRLRQMLTGWLHAEYTRQQRGRFKPRHLEYAFGLPDDGSQDEESISEPIGLPLADETLRLSGRIDRIDRDDDGHYVLYDYKMSLGRYRGCHKLDQTTNFQLPLYVLAYRRQLAAQAEQGEPVGAGFYSLRPQESYERLGLWQKAALSDLGLSTRMRSGVTPDIAAEAERVLSRIQALLHRIRLGWFYMLPEHEPHPFYGDGALYRYERMEIQHKARLMTSEEGESHEEHDGTPSRD